ncbi:MAG: hypothetical protein ABL919_02885 [Methylococcales bacterium]
MTFETAALLGMGLVVIWGGLALLLAFKPWRKTHPHWDDAHHSSRH